ARDRSREEGGYAAIASARPSSAGRRMTTSVPRRARGCRAGAAKNLMPRANADVVARTLRAPNSSPPVAPAAGATSSSSESGRRSLMVRPEGTPARAARRRRRGARAAASRVSGDRKSDSRPAPGSHRASHVLSEAEGAGRATLPAVAHTVKARSSSGRVTRVAVIADVHGNAPALRAVLGELAESQADLLVSLGDVTWGVQPEETRELLQAVELPAIFVSGNGERALRELHDGRDGTERERWMRNRHSPETYAFLDTFVEHAVVHVDGLGDVRFCH